MTPFSQHVLPVMNKDTGTPDIPVEIIGKEGLGDVLDFDMIDLLLDLI